MTAKPTDPNFIISSVLMYGTALSTALVAVGLVLLLVNPPPSSPATLQQTISAGYGRPTLSVSALFSGLASFDPPSIIELGLLVLLATPVVRVGTSVLVFFMERDMTYVAITLFVLLTLLFAIFVIGPIVTNV